jgi:hypothetical protein
LSPKIDRNGGFQIVIYPDDHPPPHVHVFNAGAECVLLLGDFVTAPSVREVNGMKTKDVVKAYRLVEASQARYILKWREIHGT